LTEKIDTEERRREEREWDTISLHSFPVTERRAIEKGIPKRRCVEERKENNIPEGKKMLPEFARLMWQRRRNFA
jgi:hypothetical protein